MRRNFVLLHFLFLFFSIIPLHSRENFKVVALGCGGGPLENNVSGYLLAPKDSDSFIALDAGTLLGGIFIAKRKNSFQGISIDPNSEYSIEGAIFRDCIKAYLISHAHLDHVAGLVINSQADTKKPIFGLPSTIDNIRDHLFNWKIWPNFGSEGSKPLNQYQYQRLKEGHKITIAGTEMTVEAYPLSHPGQYLSTAFLLESKDSYVMYFGDTAPDALSPKKRLIKVWERIAPLIRQNKMCGIFIECADSDLLKSNQLHGHLDPKYLMQELSRLASLVDPANTQTCLKGFKVFVTHIKDSLLKGPSARQRIEQELAQLNNLGIDFIFPEQGQKLEL